MGVNQFQVEEKLPSGLLRVDPTVRDAQMKKLEKIRSQRDADAVNTALAELKKAAEGTDNIMPPILDAVKKNVTLGEICGVLRQVFGEYTHGGSQR